MDNDIQAFCMKQKEELAQFLEAKNKPKVQEVQKEINQSKILKKEIKKPSVLYPVLMKLPMVLVTKPVYGIEYF